MKECPICGACYQDKLDFCRVDGTPLRFIVSPGDSNTIIIDDKYLLDTWLGKGGTGTVYKAVQLMLQRQVAIKILNPKLTMDPRVKERFHREALAIAKLKHPHIVSIYDFGFSLEGYAYLVMELINGFSLRRLLTRWPKCKLEFCLDIARQVCQAIAVAHSYGVLHRDLKPENIMFEGLTGTTLIKVVDFGLAKLATDNVSAVKITDPHIILGTAHYMSPEQCRGEEINWRSDIYSLGILIYELVTGRVPFIGSSSLEVMAMHMMEEPTLPAQVVAEIPAQLEQLILCTLEKEPDKRPVSAQEIADGLTELLIQLSPTRGVRSSTGLLKANYPVNPHLQAQSIREQIEKLKDVCIEHPQDGMLAQQLAELYQQIGAIAETINNFIRAGDLLREVNEWELAMAAYSKVRTVVSLPRRAAIANKLASIYYKLNAFKQTYQECRQVLIYYLGRQRWEEANKYLQTVPPSPNMEANYREELVELVTNTIKEGVVKWQFKQGLDEDLSEQIILIADPDPLTCSNLARVLRELGCQVHLASTAKQVWELTERHRPTLIISELQLTDITGSELLHKLRYSTNAQDTIFVCLSAVDEGAEIDAAFAQGVDDYWCKPFDINVISRRVKRLLLRNKCKRWISGGLSENALIEILQQLEQKARTGYLTVSNSNDGEEAKICFVDGIIVNIIFNTFLPIGAFYRILAWDEGVFYFRPATVTLAQPLRLTCQQLILEILKFYDEEQKVVSQLPPLNTYLKLAAMGDERQRVKDLISLFDGSRTISDCLSYLRGDSEALELLLELFQANKEKQSSSYLSSADIPSLAVYKQETSN